ncbi:MAG TPA: PEP-CTERM sorting domain-containing protein [Nostocaceae cyanobacterium]|nr:PEP-CTERM sorting domain-containing protein [Nostocaceae cyanobacterium]
MSLPTFVKNLSIATLGAATITVASVNQASASPLVNGDFETGDLTGWTTFTTSNGTLGEGYPQVVPFDTDNNGTLSNSAKFRVGEGFYTGIHEGGGIFQNVLLSAGNLNISANIAALGGRFDNASGGKVQLLFDNVVLDSHDFSNISAGQAEYSFLSSINNVTAGLHEIRFLFTRPFVQNSITPTQYIDNIVLSGTATQAVPEPTSMLGLLAVGSLSAFSLIKRKQQQS